MSDEPKRPDASKDSIDERIEKTCRMLCKRLYKHEIKQLLKARYRCSARTCENYLARARERLLERAGTSRKEKRSEALSLYEDIIRDPSTTTGEKLVAQGRIDELFALKMPATTNVNLKGNVGMQVEVIETIVRTREDVQAALSALPPAG